MVIRGFPSKLGQDSDRFVGSALNDWPREDRRGLGGRRNDSSRCDVFKGVEELSPEELSFREEVRRGELGRRSTREEEFDRRFELRSPELGRRRGDVPRADLEISSELSGPDGRLRGDEGGSFPDLRKSPGLSQVGDRLFGGVGPTIKEPEESRLDNESSFGELFRDEIAEEDVCMRSLEAVRATLTLR